MDNPTWNDAQLVFASRQGNLRAFAALVNRYKGLVSAIAYSSTCDPILSQDLAQETFTVAWRKLNEIHDPDRFRPWLCGVVRHLIQQALRERERASQHILRSRESATRTQASPPTPCDAAVAREQAEAVAGALARLPEEYRLPLVLYYYEGQSSRLVAEALGITEEAVRQRLVRARQHLREELSKLVDTTLERQRPSRAFVIAVLARLGEIPAAPLAAIRASFSALAVKTVAALGLCVAGTLAIWAFSPAERIDAGANTPTGPVLEKPAADSVQVEPTPVAPYLPPVSAAPAPPLTVPARDQNADAIALAVEILERAWTTQPSPAARSLCVEAWGYLAALGDEAFRTRLVREASDPTSGEYGPSSCQMLTGVLYDKAFLDGVYRACANRSANARLRIGHFGTLYWSTRFLQSQGVRFPDAVTDAAVEIIEQYGPITSTCLFVEQTATERARPMAEYYLLASAQGVARPMGGGGGGGFGSVQASGDIAEEFYSGKCLADGCLAILERIGNPESCPVLREYISYGGDVDAAFAACVLCKLGDRAYGVEILNNLLASTNDPSDQIRYRGCLVKVGERQHIEGIKAAMASNDENVRMEAYCALCKLNNSAFVEPAIRDFPLYGENGFWHILRNSPEISFPTESGIRLHYNEAFTAYCLALVASPEAVRPEDLSGAQMAEQGLVGLCDSPDASKALDACRPALSVDGGGLQDLAIQCAWVTKLVFLIRWGEPETRRRAADAITDACRRNELVEGHAVFKLKWAFNPEAKAPLVEIMQSSPDENHRVLAALSFLAIQSGKRL